MSLIDYFRYCHFCSKFEFKKTDYLCEVCWQELLKKSVADQLKNYEGIEMVSLFDEVNDEFSLRLNKLIYDFKYSGLLTMAERLAEFILFNAPLDFTVITQICYPTRKNKNNDHAKLLARAFSEILSVETTPLFVQGSRPQKNLSQKARRERSLVAKAPLQEAHNWLFVDDVITTGSTLKAAWRALKKPKHFQALSLVFIEKH